MWAIGEFADGLSSVAAPVIGRDGSVSGAISVHGPSYRFPGDRTDVTRHVVAAVRAFSTRLSD